MNETNKTERKYCKISIFVGSLLCGFAVLRQWWTKWLICEHCRVNRRICVHSESNRVYKYTRIAVGTLAHCSHNERLLLVLFTFYYSKFSVFIHRCMCFGGTCTIFPLRSWAKFICIKIFLFLFLLLFLWKSLNEFYSSWLLIFVCAVCIVQHVLCTVFIFEFCSILSYLVHFGFWYVILP